jgi:hypothetical protein
LTRTKCREAGFYWSAVRDRRDHWRGLYTRCVKSASRIFTGLRGSGIPYFEMLRFQKVRFSIL